METYTERIYTSKGIASENIFTQGERVLHIGSGSKVLKGATTIDALNLPGVDTVHDLNVFPWPYAESSFDIIYAQNVFEHLDDIVPVMNEVWRLLKPKGRIIISVPYFRCVDAFADPTHKHFFTSRTMNFCIDKGNGVAHYQYTTKLFSVVGFWYGWPHASKNPLKRFLKYILQANRSVYDSHLSLIAPSDIVTWELQSAKK